MNDDAVKNLDCRNGWFYCDFVDPSGRRIRKALKTRNEKIASQRLMKIQTEAYEKGYFEIRRPVKMLFSELASKVLEYVKDKKKSFNTFYIPVMKPLVKFFGEKLLHEITAKLVIQYQSMRKGQVSGSSANRELALLKRCFNLAIQWNITNFNPVKGIAFYREPKGRTRFLTQKEIECLLQYCPSWLREFVTVVVHTGMRLSEALSLKWQNIDLLHCKILLEHTKNDEPREIPMSDTVYQILANKYRMYDCKDYQPVFTPDSKKSYSSDYVYHSFKKAVRKAQLGEDICIHTLRHTWASHLAMSGVDLLTIKELGGWKTLSMVIRYSHLAEQHKREAIAKLESCFVSKGDTEEILCHKNDTNGFAQKPEEKYLEKIA